jgi:hypothetical protein
MKLTDHGSSDGGKSSSDSLVINTRSCARAISPKSEASAMALAQQAKLKWFPCTSKNILKRKSARFKGISRPENVSDFLLKTEKMFQSQNPVNQFFLKRRAAT